MFVSATLTRFNCLGTAGFGKLPFDVGGRKGGSFAAPPLMPAPVATLLADRRISGSGPGVGDSRHSRDACSRLGSVIAARLGRAASTTLWRLPHQRDTLTAGRAHMRGRLRCRLPLVRGLRRRPISGCLDQTKMTRNFRVSTLWGQRVGAVQHAPRTRSGCACAPCGVRGLGACPGLPGGIAL